MNYRTDTQKHVGCYWNEFKSVESMGCAEKVPII
jgi:hypothetical protein